MKAFVMKEIGAVGMMEKPVPGPGPNDAMDRLLRVLEAKRVDPTAMTTHTFPFDEMERAFEVADRKLDDVVKVLIRF